MRWQDAFTVRDVFGGVRSVPGRVGSDAEYETNAYGLRVGVPLLSSPGVVSTAGGTSAVDGLVVGAGFTVLIGQTKSLCGLERERDVNYVALAPPTYRQPAALEHGKHGRIMCKHLGLEGG